MDPVDGVWLFSYGTLRQREVQLTLFNRALDGRADSLPGYAVSPLLVTDPDVIATSGTAHHTIVRETGNPLEEVPGVVLRITGAGGSSGFSSSGGSSGGGGSSGSW